MAKTFEAMEKFDLHSTEQRGANAHFSQWNFRNLRSKSCLAEIISKMGIESNSGESHTFHFASASDGEGTTTILVNLALFMINNKSPKKILFIDGNLENPIFHIAFNLPPSPGLSETYRKKAILSDALHKIDNSTVYVMPSGNSAISANVGLESHAIVEFVKAIQQKFQVIIFDSPALLSSPLSLIWANAADISFMVIQANRTQWEIAQKAQKLLEKNNCKIGGVVLNQVKYSIPQWLYKRL